MLIISINSYYTCCLDVAERRIPFEHGGGVAYPREPLLRGRSPGPQRPIFRPDGLLLPVRPPHEAGALFVPEAIRVLGPLPVHRAEPLPQHRQLRILLTTRKYTFLFIFQHYIGKPMVYWMYQQPAFP